MLESISRQMQSERPAHDIYRRWPDISVGIKPAHNAAF